jgi:hypothetical protein
MESTKRPRFRLAHRGYEDSRQRFARAPSLRSGQPEQATPESAEESRL